MRIPELDRYISVDVETSGPNPSTYSLLSIGACTLAVPRQNFYVELKPASANAVPEALEVTGLRLEQLVETGIRPGMPWSAADWVHRVLPAGKYPIFVGFNAPFDWMFVNDYFQRYLDANPFGHNALDIRAYFMGLTGSQWSDASLKDVTRRYLENRVLSHHALKDAQDQAEFFSSCSRSRQNA